MRQSRPPGRMGGPGALPGKIAASVRFSQCHTVCCNMLCAVLRFFDSGNQAAGSARTGAVIRRIVPVVLWPS